MSTTSKQESKSMLEDMVKKAVMELMNKQDSDSVSSNKTDSSNRKELKKKKKKKKKKKTRRRSSHRSTCSSRNNEEEEDTNLSKVTHYQIADDGGSVVYKLKSSCGTAFFYTSCGTVGFCRKWT